MGDTPIPLSVLALDLPTPPLGWSGELAQRGITTVTDDIGRECVARSVARRLLEEHRADQERRARLRAEAEARAVEQDQKFRDSIPKGVPVVAGVTAAELLLALGSDDRPQRESVLDHALSNPAGAIIYHSIEGTATAGGTS